MKKNNYQNNNVGKIKVGNTRPGKGNEVKTDNNIVTDNKPKKSEPRVYKHPKLIFLCKVVAILAIVVAAVRYTDKKGLFEPDKTFRDTYMTSSFKQLSKKDTIDICLFGNSHIGHAFNANILSNSLGCICFNYFLSGSDLEDVYFCMKNVLQNNPIKVAVIETFVMTNILEIADANSENGHGHKLNKPLEWDNNIKLESMFKMLKVDQYPYVWSTTMRNHDFIFRDTAQMRINKDPKYEKYQTPKKLFLGSSGIQEPGISDSLDAVYDSLGARIDGSKIELNSVDREYIQKIADLCAEHNTKMVFVTVPMYNRNVKNYKDWHDLVADLIAPTEAPWYDMQLNYDSMLIKRDFFENKRTHNQHVLTSGMRCLSMLFAQYLNDSCDLKLPDRTREVNWKDICYDTDCYFFYNSPDSTDKQRINICEDKKFGNLVVKNAFFVKGEKYNEFYLKINKDSLPSENTQIVKTVVNGSWNGKNIRTVVEMYCVKDILPVKTCLYYVNLVKGFEPTGIESIGF